MTILLTLPSFEMAKPIQSMPSPEKNPLLSKNLTSLALFGLWPFQSESFLQNRRLRTIHKRAGMLVYFLFVVFLISEYIELAHVWGNLEDMTTNMSVSCLYTVGVMKIYGFFGHRKKLKKLVGGISSVETCIMEYQTDSIKNILLEYVRRARRVTYFFWTLTTCTILVFFVIPPLEYRYTSNYHIVYENGSEYWSYERPMIFSSWFPFDKFAFPNHIIAYIYQILMGTVGASYQAIWDMFVVSMMIHSIGQLQILQRMLTDLTDDYITSDLTFEATKAFKYEDPTIVWRINDEMKHRKLVNCINHHRYIIKYTMELNEILRPVMLLYFIDCSLMLCAIGFQAYLYGFSIRLCFMVEYLIAMMIQLFLFYWHGNEVICENEKLLNCSYNCHWYNEGKSFKQNLWILREGMKLPVKFTVGPFYTMCLPLFLGILRASYSYFTLLRQFQEKAN